MWRPCGAIDDTYEKDLAIVRTPLQWGLMIAGLLALFLMPHWVSGVTLNTVNLIAITISINTRYVSLIKSVSCKVCFCVSIPLESNIG